MANICENEMHVYSENPKNIKYIKEYFDEWHSAEIVEVDDDTLEIFFESRWDFPTTEMEEMAKEIPDKETIHMECLSVEWGNYYCAFNVFNVFDNDDCYWRTY